ncbi:MAG TPA: hypothetical protein VMM93_14140, partial [Vicinamibacterales bacterium]|nr:hypothetical protein [Vicinamibacterales bacterium]
PAAGRGLLVTPGTYQVRLSAGGRLYRQPLTVRMDPRVEASAADLAAQHQVSRLLHDAIGQLAAALREVDGQLAGAHPAGRQALDDRRRALDAALRPLPDLFSSVQASDARPAAAVDQAITAALERVREVLVRDRPFRPRPYPN